MPLLNEGTTVLRPVVASDMGNNRYKIIGIAQELSPENLDEDWLFPIGSYVECKIEQRAEGIILIANNLL